jgi:hypothetical protein
VGLGYHVAPMPVAMPHVRASAILARLKWVEEHHGREARRSVLVSLPPSQADAILAAVNPTSWVTFDAFISLCQAIDRLYGSGDLALCRTLGRYAAEVNLPTLYRIFYKIGSVRFIISKASTVWTTHYDSGRASTHDIPGGIAFVVEGFATPHRAHCLSVLGWMEQSATISGATVTSACEVKCRCRGDAACEFHMEYK